MILTFLLAPLRILLHIMSCPDAFLHGWHRFLSLPRQPRPPGTATTSAENSRASRNHHAPRGAQRVADISFTLSCVRRDGFSISSKYMPPLLDPRRNLSIYVCMLGKLSLRWSLWRVAAWLCGGGDGRGREMVNSRQPYKVWEVAMGYELNELEF